VFLADVQAQQSQLRQLGPVRRQRLVGCLEQGARRRARLVLGQEVCDGLGERAMIFGDGERHD
jgi:hypothetical protein